MGSNLAKELCSLQAKVHLIVRPTSDLSLLKEVKEQIIIHHHDGSYESLNLIIKRCKPQIIFHLASLFIAEHKSSDIKNLVTSNILFGTYLLESMAENNILNIINTGTSWEHENNDNYLPVNLYAASKKAFSDIILYFHNAVKISCITLKLFDTYGPNDNRQKLLDLLKNNLTNNNKLQMSKGEQLVDLVHINDVIKAFLLAGEILIKNKELAVFKEYAVTSGELISLKDLSVYVAKILEVDLSIDFGARPYRKREVMKPWNTSNIIPSWKPRYSMKESIKLFLLEN